jgi:transcriptional regulator with XRE-family HTH domain
MKVQIFSTLHIMDMKEWIKAARLHAKLTQEKLGEQMGLTKGNIWAWEKGNHEASLDQLNRIAAITGFDEPLPGTAAGQPIIKSSRTNWPFPKIDESKVYAVKGDDAIALERAFIVAAGNVGLDIKKS